MFTNLDINFLQALHLCALDSGDMVFISLSYVLFCLTPFGIHALILFRTTVHNKHIKALSLFGVYLYSVLHGGNLIFLNLYIACFVICFHTA